ncbi:MAG: thioredoxin [Candidatus Omnitrophica bacterium]|nr:thioredoxin [Candidatus Omnitrophota bacterium]
MSIVNVTENNFEATVTKSVLPVLVDFWAEWCGPCKMISPIVDEVASELEGKIKVAKVNVDEAQELAGKFNIMSIPTLLIFKQGEAVDQIVGAVGKEQLLEKLAAHVA